MLYQSNELDIVQSQKEKKYNCPQCILRFQEEKSAEDGVIDIDADTSDPVTVSAYANEIFINMKSREVRIHPCSLDS